MKVPPLLESFVKATLGPFPVAVLGPAVAFGTRTMSEPEVEGQGVVRREAGSGLRAAHCVLTLVGTRAAAGPGTALSAHRAWHLVEQR